MLSEIHFSPQNGHLDSGGKSIAFIFEDAILDHQTLDYSARWKTSSMIVSGLTIIATLPTNLVEKESSVITVSVTNDSGSTTQNIVPVVGQKQEVVHSEFRGSPNVPIADAFGPGYDMFTCASLDAVNFTVAPALQKRQSILQNKDQFNWVVAPNSSGQQTVSIPIVGIWVPKMGGQPIERVLAMPTFRLNVAESHPNLSPPSFFDMSPLNFGALMLTLIGAFLNVIPWILDRFRERKMRGNIQALNSTKTAEMVSVNPKRQKKRRRVH